MILTCSGLRDISPYSRCCRAWRKLDWVMHYAAALASGYRFHSIQNVKFAAPLLPENTVTLLLAWQPERQLLTFSYQRHAGNERHTASSGKIRLCQ